jgi:hypothetical protein
MMEADPLRNRSTTPRADRPPEEVPPDEAPAREPAGPAAPPDTASTLSRLEKLVEEIRSGLDARLREQAHKDFSAAWLAGAVLQVLVVGLVVMAGLDCLFQSPVGRPMLKLAFALVLQLMALTAFVLAGEGRR